MINEEKNLSAEGMAFIQSWEKLRLKPYLDSGGVPTIGYGMTYYPDSGQRVTLQDKPLTPEQATAQHKLALRRYEAAVNRYVQVSINQPQFDELVSLAYNIGAEALRQSTLLRRLNQGNYSAASAQFGRWVYDNGRREPGLVNRRLDERAMFDRGVYCMHN